MTARTGLTQWIGALASAATAKQARAAGALRHLVGPALGTEDLEEREERAAARHQLEQALAASGGLAGRAGARWLDDEIGHQNNRESVAELTAEILVEDDGNGDSGEEPTLDPDWLNLFASHAEKASGDSLREMWARVLAGEIRKPGAISLRTLQFASTLDLPTAKAMQAMASWVYNGTNLPYLAGKKLPFETLQLLHDEGLIGSLDSNITNSVTLPEGWAAAMFGDIGVFFKGSPGQVLSLPGISVSRVAKEFLGTISLTRDQAVPLAFAEDLQNDSLIQAIRVGPCQRKPDGTFDMPGATLIKDWTRPIFVPPVTPGMPGMPYRPPGT
ncbi:DUF2806 domain-containing protein [Brevundimonas sp. P7753]|uniref:DUF2806 domain-containing protein n=1 Tax=Brevundimonas sp. P7753 TaxID=2726982 RepID=UPI0015BE2D1B|nr:DUF2806 domain-containing protein [Brevundimonas sp. P7753]NWE53318.1 DUF2806 domain-containing protein [Brevundimonas sp. P7753]